jgi:hypothetical protein
MAGTVRSWLGASETSPSASTARRARLNAWLAGALLLLLLLTAACVSKAVPSRSSGAQPDDTGAMAGITSPVIDAPSGGTHAPQTSTSTSSSSETVAMDDCPAGLSPNVVSALQAADVPQGQRWLYPYDTTVMPRGLAAPMLQWDVPADAIYLHLHSSAFDYKGCFQLSQPAASLPIPQDVWDVAAAQSTGKQDPLTIDLTMSTGATLVRLPPLHLIFALASLKSAVYYNTFNSALGNQQGIFGSVVMRILPGASQPDIFLRISEPNGNCIGCHSVSASGNRMTAQTNGPFDLSEVEGGSYDLSSVAAQEIPPLKSRLPRGAFAALTPDGSKFVIQGAMTDNFTGPVASDGVVTNVPLTGGPQTSGLYETDTGKEILDSGMVPYPYMPMFSVDGALIVFNHADPSDPMTGHSLAVMDFAAQTNKFSNLRAVYRSETRFPAWPFFLPEVVRDPQGGGSAVGRRVIFALGECSFSTAGLTYSPQQSDLWWLDIDSGVASPLAAANGDDPSGKTYLPYAARDAHLSFFPTVSPVAAGGYFWLFFTSKRNYGNALVTEQAQDHPESKKIWVSAIDIEASPGSDPSHPAFYLPGQELESGSVRAFAALDACRADGDSCASGIDCCCGFCTGDKCECSQTPACSKLDEKCGTAADCCDKALSCIGGFCGEVILQ